MERIESHAAQAKPVSQRMPESTQSSGETEVAHGKNVMQSNSLGSKAAPAATGSSDPVRAEFAEHLAGIGFELHAPREVIMEKLRQRMGDQRFNDLVATAMQPRTVWSEEQLCSQPQDMIEGNLLRSLDPGVTLDASYSLYKQFSSFLRPGMRVIELGCWTGGLTSFIAKRHPACSVVGVDAAQKMIEVCETHFHIANLRFLRWDYRQPKPQELEPADMLVCAFGVAHPLSEKTSLPVPSAVRGSGEYVAQHDQALAVFSMWRAAARDGALLFAVFRLNPFPRFLAWIDSAQEAGWTTLLDRLWRVELPGHRTVVPGFVFEARRSELPSEEAVVERWTSFVCQRHLYARFGSESALSAYRSLNRTGILATREYSRNGVLTRDEVGLSDSLGYVFTHDVDSNYRLLLVSSIRAKQLAEGVSVRGSSITKDATFEDAPVASSPASVVNTNASTGGSFGIPRF